MNYHHRYSADDTYEVICTRCFSTVGVVKGSAAAKEIESRHMCAAEVSQARFSGMVSPDSSSVGAAVSKQNWQKRILEFSARLEEWHITLLLLSVALVFYFLPSTLESLVIRYWGVWWTCIVLGDLLGCFGMAAIWGLRRISIALYLLLTSFEGYLYTTHLASAGALIWITDLVPTVVILSMIMYRHSMHIPRVDDLL